MDELPSLTNFHLEEQMSTEIRYADDTTLISLIFEKLKLSSEELENACKKWGLKINSTKCKVITTEVNDHITINDQIVENVENFNFLGSTIPNTSDDVLRRIGLASSAFGRLKKNVWSRKDLSNQIKLRLYKSLIVPIAIYA